MGEADDQTPELPRSPRARSTRKQIILALIAYSTTLAPSTSIGFSAVAIPALRNDPQVHLTESQLSWFASVASIATPLGCLCSGPSSDRFGRKAVLLMVNLITLLGWVIIGAAMHVTAHRYALLLVGRLVTGFSTGFAGTAIVYMSEVSTLNLRGVFTSASGIFIAIGILMVYLFGALFPDHCGRVAVLIAFIPCVCMVLVMCILPETPQWLVIRQRIDEAGRNMQRIYGFDTHTQEIHDDLTALRHHADANRVISSQRTTLWRRVRTHLAPFTRPSCYRPYLIVQAFFFFQQFAGTFVILFYAIDIVQMAGVRINAHLAIVVIALVRLVAAVGVAVISRSYGRRPISLVSGVGMTGCMLLLAAHLHWQWASASWLPFASLLVYIFASTLGFITMPFAIAAECFPAEIRGTLTSVVTAFGYLFNFVVVKFYPRLVTTIDATGAFLFFAAFSAAGTLFVYFLLPETKGRTLLEIEEYFSGQSQTKRKSEHVKSDDDLFKEQMLPKL